jgi:predicted RNA-binding protein with PUA-like domain
VIKEDKMIDLLVDIHLVDGQLYNYFNVPEDSISRMGGDMFSAVFRKHHTDSTQFNNSYAYYAAQPEKMNKLYDQVIIKLTALNEHYNKLHLDSVKKVQVRDSIRNAARLDSLKKIATQDSLRNAFKKDSIRKVFVKDSLDKVKRDSLKKARRDSLKKASPAKSSNKTVKSTTSAISK